MRNRLRDSICRELAKKLTSLYEASFGLILRSWTSRIASRKEIFSMSGYPLVTCGHHGYGAGRPGNVNHYVSAIKSGNADLSDMILFLSEQQMSS